ncbi:hypothetical protein B296_00018650 [Ensete ventricosum]|uniref:Uncharacterized protein n=1 Tax=Ensete ventricosum TaxID=4639 RepID=A0A427AQ84_ENSVE|nr:hypothetical protein B296_00018650 [Ensete ventricosum]
MLQEHPALNVSGKTIQPLSKPPEQEDSPLFPSSEKGTHQHTLRGVIGAYSKGDPWPHSSPMTISLDLLPSIFPYPSGTRKGDKRPLLAPRSAAYPIRTPYPST